MPVFAAYPCGRRLDAVVVSRIDVDEGRAELARRFGATLRVAGTGQHGVTQIDEPPGCLVAQALVGPGDQRDRHHVSLQHGESGDGAVAVTGRAAAAEPWPVRYGS